MEVQIPSVLTSIARFNAATVAPIVVTAVLTPLVSIAIPTVIAGQLLFFDCHLVGLKGATPGDVELVIRTIAGTGTIDFLNGTTLSGMNMNLIPAVGVVSQPLNPIGIITASGTLTMEFGARSLLSNLTATAAATGMRILQILR